MAFKEWVSLAGIVVLGIVAILPVVFGFPPTIGPPPGHDITFVLLAIVVLFAVWLMALAIRTPDEGRSLLLKRLAFFALISIAASEILRLDIQFPVYEIPTPHVLTPLLRADGEEAYDADVFEIYCEIWVFVAAMFALGVYG